MPCCKNSAATAVDGLVRDLPTADLPGGEQWLAHFVRDLLPYWSSPEALGEPVGYVTANARRGEPVHLYYARPEGDEAPAFRPYVFDGDAETVRSLPLAQLPGYERVEVRFENVR